jgi:hypothetical protein
MTDSSVSTPASHGRTIEVQIAISAAALRGATAKSFAAVSCSDLNTSGLLASMFAASQ